MRVRLSWIAATLLGCCALLIGSSIPAGSSVHANRKLIQVATIPGPTHEFGINIRWSDYGQSEKTVAAELKKCLPYIRSLGANSVALAFNFYVSSPTSNAVISGPDTPPPADIALFTYLSHLSGLAVLLRPLIQETNPNAPWRGRIQPTNPQAWFTSYESLLKPYLQAAQSTSANAFAFSVELEDLGSSPLWTSSFVPFAKKYFKGTLMYDTSWEKPGLKPIANEAYGLDMYPPMPAADSSDSATVSQLLKGWNEWLKHYPIGASMAKTYIVEVGIASQAKAYTHPSLHNWNTPIIPSIQSKWFAAACEFYRTHKFRGLYFWSISLTTGPPTSNAGNPGDFKSLTPAAIKSCFH